MRILGSAHVSEIHTTSLSNIFLSRCWNLFSADTLINVSEPLGNPFWGVLQRFFRCRRKISFSILTERCCSKMLWECLRHVRFPKFAYSAVKCPNFYHHMSSSHWIESTASLHFRRRHFWRRSVDLHCRWFLKWTLTLWGAWHVTPCDCTAHR